ncbi:MAG: hydroxymethylpyrimidine/phosphomethylpyrimidine kinase [Deltaproteobacteria bacterium]|nr:MAG: hydroxymethylpyrimidine/phosphomethylpyrimidine kinase [Deltaproteobacteria bacterium]
MNANDGDELIRCLVIAGWDPTAGAGALADCEALGWLGARPLVALTTVTAQNRRRVLHPQPVAARRLERQLEAISESGRIDAVKIGLLGTAANCRVVERWLEAGVAGRVPVVLDPVVRASSGGMLAEPTLVGQLRRLLRLVDVVCPNAYEAGLLAGMGSVPMGMQRRISAARKLALQGPAVVVTGGDTRRIARDILVRGDDVLELRATRIPKQAPGTGCRFTAALACLLAGGRDLIPAVRRAAKLVRRYIHSYAG